MGPGDVLQSVIKAILDNLPQAIGVALAAIIMGFFGWLGNKILRKPKDSSSATAAVPWQSHDKVTRQYMSDLIRRGSSLSFGDPASWAVDSSDAEGLVTLDQIWTPLRVADSMTRKGKSGTHESMAEKGEGRDLRQLFDSTDEALLILGDPGSGKSTSLAMFAVDAARTWSRDKKGRLPIWVSLATIVGDEKTDPEPLLLSGVPEVGLAITRLGLEGGADLSRWLSATIIQGDALLLLDGLDEVKDHMLPRVRKAILHLLGLRTGTRIVVTCRKFDYRQFSPNRKLTIERELELLPYNQTEQQLYVERWYAAAVRIGRFSTAQAHDLSAALINELRGQAISELAESPLLLALLTLIHSEEAKLPDTRAVVCDRAISYMLADAAKWRGREAGSSTLATPPVRALAVELGYRSYVRTEEGGAGVGITDALVRELASQICEVMRQADMSTKAPLPNELAERFLKGHGLLLDVGNGQYKFAHRSFQEFLAGQYFAAGAHHTEALSRASSIHWREPFQLMASFAGHEGGNLFYILTLIDKLLSVDTSGPISSIQLGAEMLAEIGRRRLALRQFGSVLEKNGLWARAQHMLLEHVENPKLSLAERERSAAVLGSLGDPRFVSESGLVGPWDHLIDVPAGVANVGTARLDEELVKRSGGFVGPIRRLEFGQFRIGRYPVTNAEYRLFVEGDGYTNPEYWKGQMARGWVSGDPRVLEAIRTHWLSTVYEHHAKEIRDKEIDTKRLEEESTNRTAPRKTPYYWLDRRFNGPNQPVVGINYWEALAYCQWATEIGHQSGSLDQNQEITLPTEFEWERASRQTDDDRIYEWGDLWTDEKAHVSTNMLNMRQPAPVGIYLEPWKGGPCDLAGNVWEWMASLHFPYTTEYDQQRLSDDSLEERIVRGSSWYNTGIVAACSARCVDRSYNLFYDVGFRVVSHTRGSPRTGCH